MDGFKAILGGLLGSAFGLLMLGFGVLSFPLNVVAVMHLWGWEWWSAAIGATLFACIPVLGQIGYFVLAIMGGYYLWQADFDWRMASTSQTPSTFTVESLSPEKFSEFKAKQIRPGLERSCKVDAKAYVGFDGKIPITASNFCECYARTAVEIITKEDLVYQENHSGYPTDFEDRMKAAVRARCRV